MHPSWESPCITDLTADLPLQAAPICSTLQIKPQDEVQRGGASDNAGGGDEYGADNGYSEDCNEDTFHEGGSYEGCFENGGSQWSLDSATAAKPLDAVSAHHDDGSRSEGSAERRPEDYQQTTDARTHEISCVSADSSEPSERGTSLVQEFRDLATKTETESWQGCGPFSVPSNIASSYSANAVPDECRVTAASQYSLPGTMLWLQTAAAQRARESQSQSHCSL